MKPFALFSIVVAIFLSSCGTLAMGIEPATKTVPSVIATQIVSTTAPADIVIPTATKPAAQATEDISPSKTVTAASQVVQLYFIALEDNGKSGPLVGCGDSAVPVQIQIAQTQGVLKAALEALLSNKSRDYGESGLYNALYQSDLKLQKATIVDGEALVDLTGTLQLGGECDNPRVQAQLEQTVLQFSTVKKATITLNGKPLSEALSLK